MSAVAAEPVWTLPASAFELSLSEMARDGMRGNEGIALWLGRRRGQVNEVSHVIALRGKGIARRPNVLIITPELMNEVTDVAVDLGMTLIGQVHSPPGHRKSVVTGKSGHVRVHFGGRALYKKNKTN